VNVGEVQKKLSVRAERAPEHRFGALYSLLYNEAWLRAAYANVKTNRGSQTAGVDGISIRTFNEDLETNLRVLGEQLRAQTFAPLPVRRPYIREQKADGRIKISPLGIPALRDRIVQEAVRMILEPIWEADFYPWSYGFRPCRSTQQAIASLGRSLIGSAGRTFQWVIEGDIASYFDTIAHRKLVKCVRKRVKDRRLLDLIWGFLRAGILEKGKLRSSLTEAPQGGVLSPVLSNAYSGRRLPLIPVESGSGALLVMRFDLAVGVYI
jgi:group II intron reverse transcriptase/maturase